MVARLPNVAFRAAPPPEDDAGRRPSRNLFANSLLTLQHWRVCRGAFAKRGARIRE